MLIFIKKYSRALLIVITPVLFWGCLRTYYPMYYYSSSLPIVNEANNNLDEGTEYLSLDHTYSETGYTDEFVNMIPQNRYRKNGN